MSMIRSTQAEPRPYISEDQLGRMQLDRLLVERRDHLIREADRLARMVAEDWCDRESLQSMEHQLHTLVRCLGKAASANLKRKRGAA